MNSLSFSSSFSISVIQAVLQSLRLRIETPVLILSGLEAVEDKVKGLGFGADDYLTKQYAQQELVEGIMLWSPYFPQWIRMCEEQRRFMIELAECCSA